MFFKFKNHYISLLILFLIFLTSCQLKESSKNHGILFLENRSKKLIVNKTNQNDTISIIGQPHSKSINNENEWIYIERIFTKGKFHKLGKNVLTANNVLYLEFNKYGLLENKKLFDKNSINKIKFSKKITENDLSKTSFIEGLFSSLRAKMYGKK